MFQVARGVYSAVTSIPDRIQEIQEERERRRQLQREEEELQRQLEEEAKMGRHLWKGSIL